LSRRVDVLMATAVGLAVADGHLMQQVVECIVFQLTLQVLFRFVDILGRFGLGGCEIGLEVMVFCDAVCVDDLVVLIGQLGVPS